MDLISDLRFLQTMNEKVEQKKKSCINIFSPLLNKGICLWLNWLIDCSKLLLEQQLYSQAIHYIVHFPATYDQNRHITQRVNQRLSKSDNCLITGVLSIKSDGRREWSRAFQDLWKNNYLHFFIPPNNQSSLKIKKKLMGDVWTCYKANRNSKGREHPKK